MFPPHDMAVNYIHSLLHRVDSGWDPIPSDYAKGYAEYAWQERRPAIVDMLEQRVGGLSGKRILDLGGGPGQYSVLFAQRGAQVTWHDISREYAAIARNRAQAADVTLNFSLGYLEAAKQFESEPFDLVFCRVCWYYARSDRHFAHMLYSLIKPGGVGYIESNISYASRLSGFPKLQYFLNKHLWWKIGHPMPPRGRIAVLMNQFPIDRMVVDYSSKDIDIVSFDKPSLHIERAHKLL